MHKGEQMKRLAVVLIFLTLPLFGQNQPAAQDNAQTQAEGEEQSTQSSVEAPGQVQWGSNFNTVRENVKGSLKYYEQDKLIVSQEGEITYSYGFFYADPEMTGEDQVEAEAANQDAQPAAEQPAEAGQGAEGEAQNNQAAENEPQFSYVVMQFPYLSMEEIKAKYVEKYGDPSSEVVENNKGVIIWESEETMITMWIDEYENKPYCRKINYLSKAFTEKLKDYRNKVFNKKEIDTLNRIQP